MKKTVHIVTTNKGGAGKTCIARLLAEYLAIAFGQRPLVLDLDPANPILSRFSALQAIEMDIVQSADTNGMEIDPAKFDLVIDRVLDAEAQHIVLDIGTPTFMSFMRYLTADGGLDVLGEAGLDVLFHSPLTGGEALDFTVNALEASLNAGLNVLVWENEFFGPVVKDGVSFADSALARVFAGQIPGIIRMPALKPALHGNDWRMMSERSLTFGQATNQHPDFGRMAAHRLAKLWANYASQLQRIPALNPQEASHAGQ